LVAYGAGGFTTRDVMRFGLPFAAMMYALIVLLMFTYWPIVGLWK
jgi:solute carrier family 13 (sodium-dependent dicarboxylate transporter), member 2/3/5